MELSIEEEKDRQTQMHNDVPENDQTGNESAASKAKHHGLALVSEEKSKTRPKSGREHMIGLMLSMLKIGCIGFGGGSALIPVIEREVVTEQKLVTKKEYNKDVVVACITPGALPVEIATGLGKRAYGVKGMLGAALLMAFPGVLFTVVLLSVLNFVSDTVFTQIQYLSIGLGAFISCLLASYAIKSMQDARRVSRTRYRKAWIIMLGVFLLSCGKTMYGLFGIDRTPLFGLSTVQVLGLAFFGILYTNCRFNKRNIAVSAVTVVLYIACVGKIGLIENTVVHYAVVAWMAVLSIRGLYQSIVRDAKGQKKQRKRSVSARTGRELIAWIIFLAVCSIPAVWITRDTIPYLIRGLASSAISFGGGDAYLSVADGMFVANHTITGQEFYSSLVPVANVLPGSILCKMLAGIGYYLGFNIAGSTASGYAVALAGFACSVAASGAIFCAIYYIYEAFERVSVFQQISKWIRPIISGLLLNVMFSMFSQNLSSGTATGTPVTAVIVITAVVFALDLFLLLRRETSNLILIAISAAAGLLACNAVHLF